MNSIRRQLTRRLLGALCLLLAAGLIAVYAAVRTALVREFDETLRAKALAISTETEQSNEKIEVDFSDRFMRGFDDSVATDFFELWGADGTLIAGSESMGKWALPRRTGTLTVPQFWNLTLPNGIAGRAIGFSFTPKLSHKTPKTVPHQEVQLVVAVDCRPLNGTLATLLGIIVSCGVLLIGAIVVVVPRVLRAGLRPLDRLGDEATGITADTLATRFAMEQLPAELQPIAQRLNDLLARLQQSFERERRFSADLAHELRTPLAELRSLAEFALKWPESREPETDRETLAVAQHMEGMVTRMLALARSERGQLPLSCEMVELGRMVETMWGTQAGRATAKMLRADFNMEQVTVDTDSVLLRTILGNLLENAVEYTPVGGAIAVKIAVEGDRFTLAITNQVADFDPADVARLFDRFWRKEASRTGEEHAGLGLALAREFARAMGWELTAELTDREHLAFTLTGLRQGSVKAAK